MALDSDASGADSALWVEFENSMVLNAFKSEQEGRPIHEDIVLTKIRVPGNSTLEISRPLLEEDKRRFPLQWAHFMNTQGQGEAVTGTPIAELPGISRAVVENLRALKFHTVEQVAQASDASIGNLQMTVGMAPLAFRDRCQRYLSAASDNAVSTKLEHELAERDAKLAAMEGMMKQMQETLKAQQEMIALQEERQMAEHDKPTKDKAA